MSIGAIGMQTPLTTNRQNQFIWGGPKAEILEMDEVIDATTVDAGSWNQAVLRSGLAMGKITASGRLKQWDLAATDGSQNLYGFLKMEAEMIDRYLRAKRDFQAVIVKAPVKAKSILYLGTTIIGHASEQALRAQIRRRFLLDDEAGVDAAAPNAFYLRRRFSLAEINAGATILPAVPGQRYRLFDISLISIGGNAAGATSVDVRGTQSASVVNLLAAAVAGLTQNTLLRAGATNAAILAGGLSFVQNDVNTAITIARTGSNLSGSTHVDALISYDLSP